MSVRRANGAAGRFGDSVIAIALSVFAIGNLALTSAAQEALGFPYLIPIVGVLALMVFVRLPLLLGRSKSWLFPLVVGVAFVPGFVVSPVGGYGMEKAQTFLMVGIVILAASVFRSVTYGARAFVSITFVASVAMSLAVLTLGAASQTGRLTVAGMNPIGVARLAGAASVIALGLLISGGVKRLTNKLVLVVTIVVCVVAMIATGSRGPVVSTGAGLILCVILLMRDRKFGLRHILGFGILAAAATWVVFASDVGGLGRILEGGDTGRSGLYGEAVNIAVANPAGIGWGNFVDYAWTWEATVDGRLYPHNVFLESWVEGGIVALVGVILILVSALRSVFTTTWESRPLVMVTASFFAYAVANAQFSSDIVGNRMLWVAVAIAIALKIPDQQPASKKSTLDDDSHDDRGPMKTNGRR